MSGEVAAGAATPGTRAVVLFALGVPGVPEVQRRDALWQAEQALGP